MPRILHLMGAWTFATVWFALTAGSSWASVVGTLGLNDLTIAAGGTTEAKVLVSSGADAIQTQAAMDLAKYIGLMSGATPEVVREAGEIAHALTADSPVFLVGDLALDTDPTLNQKLASIAKRDPVIRADAIVVHRDGSRVYLAGTNAESHYHAVAWLLTEWGCRWYLPTDLGECVPLHDRLSIGDLSHVYAPPFEMRSYWISWNGSNVGRQDFTLRNFMNGQSFAGKGHALARYTRDLAPEGGSAFNVPFADIQTARHVVERMAPAIEANPAQGISLAIEDGAYENDSPEDARLQAGLRDKYFLKPFMTDPMMELYANVGKLMKEQFPESDVMFGGMAYVNVTIPPQRRFDIPENLVMWVAPIDIDPIHGMDDHNSPPRQEYREMVYRWADLMDGRVCIYDYDQGMLVWRDIPNPSHMAFRQDVRHYANAGIIGVNTESRNAIATIFTNLFFRGQLMWNPDADVDGLLAEFYENFYGPTAEPMADYWNAIYKAWEQTIVTEHEYHLAPAIYTPDLLATLRGHMERANDLIKPLLEKPAEERTRHEHQYVERMELANHMWAVLDSYMAMVFAGARDGDYAAAESHGLAAMEARLALARLNPTLTTRVVGPSPEPVTPGGSAAWLPGEVRQYVELNQLTNGERGRRIMQLPLEWAFRRDPNDTGLARGFAYRSADLTYWRANRDQYTIETLKDYPTTEWEVIRTDLYAQAQGVRHPDRQSFTGYLWYKTDVALDEAALDQPVHVPFPGLFNEAWLYVNGFLVAHRPQREMWWRNNYRAEWTVDLSEHLKPGENNLTVRTWNPHHYGGMFRRPFLFHPVD